jgi:hypothetical protein
MKCCNKTLIAIIVLASAFALFASCKGKTVSSGNSITWRTDKPPVEKRIPLLVPFEACIWHSGKLTNNSGGWVPGLDEYFIRGFVKIPGETTKRLLKDFDWKKTQFDIAKIHKPTTASIADEFLNSKELLESESFMHKHQEKSSFSLGRIILNPQSNMLYFELANL